MKAYMVRLWIIMLLLLLVHTAAYASWGWETTDDPVPYYYQEWGKWYQYDDNKVFMVQLNDKTYKYIFDSKGNLMSGWLTYMAMRLP